MKKVLIGLILLFLLITIWGLYSFYKTADTFDISQPQSIPPIPGLLKESQQTSTDNVVDWLTYKDAKLGFELQYPKEWVLETQYDNNRNYFVGVGTKKTDDSRGPRFEFFVEQNYQTNCIPDSGWYKGMFLIDERKVCLNSSGLSVTMYSKTDQIRSILEKILYSLEFNK